MNQTFIHKANNPQLTVFFLGWGMDEKPFAGYAPQDADLMVCYDYRTLDWDETLLLPYKEIRLIGWSMGVWAASQVMAHPTLPITQSIAINGTPYPIDEARGIAPAIFEGTLNGLNEATLQKFRLRMCGSATAYKEFAEVAPRRSVEELKEELAAIGQQYKELPTSPFVWDKALIGNADRIFLPDNQARAWQGTSTATACAEAAHYSTELFKTCL